MTPSKRISRRAEVVVPALETIIYFRSESAEVQWKRIRAKLSSDLNNDSAMSAGLSGGLGTRILPQCLCLTAPSGENTAVEIPASRR